MNNKIIELQKVDTIVLVGGLGTRIAPVLKDRPKCLATINGKPFIDILLDQLINSGLERFIICVGHLSQKVIDYLRKRNDCEIIFSIEKQPLGTGGAIKNAIPFIKNNLIFIVNGDTFIDYDINEIYNNKKKNFGVILAAKKKNSFNYGSLQLDKNNYLIDFKEKNADSKNQYINTGQLLFDKRVLSYFPQDNKFSFEHDILPTIVKNEKIKVVKTNSRLLDIGTPTRLSFAKQHFNTIFDNNG